jgi:glutamate-1-semialdehyde 2,1-aminomutase
MPRPGNQPGLRLGRSRSLLERARAVEAMVDARPDLFFTGIGRLGGLPVFVKRAAGPYLWDVDSNRYLDLLLGYGSVVLGHAEPRVERAVARQRRSLGANPTLLGAKQVELAERLVSLCPGVEAVTFLKTGSDATDAAIRLARAVTGRELVLRWGMNGWHDWCAPVNDGVVREAQSATLPLRYGDLDEARRLFATRGGEIAAVLLMPYDVDPPDRDYLLGLQALCRSYGALFILDEIRSGFRIAMGGIQEKLGITADLVTYGKAIANGHALSVLGGAKRYMRDILRVGLTITYFRQPDAMAAALATIDLLIEQDGPAKLERLGGKLMRGVDAAAVAAAVPARAVGLAATPFVRFSCGSPAADERAMRIFCNAMLEQGVLATPAHHWFLCTSATDADIDFAVEACGAAMREVAGAI